MYVPKTRPKRGQETRPETKNIGLQALEVRSGRACVDERAARAERVSTHLERHRAQANKHGARDALAQHQMCNSAAADGHGACTCTQEIYCTSVERRASGTTVLLPPCEGSPAFEPNLGDGIVPVYELMKGGYHVTGLHMVGDGFHEIQRACLKFHEISTVDISVTDFRVPLVTVCMQTKLVGGDTRLHPLHNCTRHL